MGSPLMASTPPVDTDRARHAMTGLPLQFPTLPSRPIGCEGSPLPSISDAPQPSTNSHDPSTLLDGDPPPYSCQLNPQQQRFLDHVGRNLMIRDHDPLVSPNT
jgi:hypothetical protein